MEMLVAILLLSIAIIPMVGMFDAGLRAASTSGNYDRARSLANSNLEVLKAKGFSAAETPPPGSSPYPCPSSPTGFTCSIYKTYVYVQSTGSDTAIFKDSGSGDPKDMLKVKITVEWGNGNSYNTTGVVAK